jgi:carboxyl-terminal processing protease
MRRPSRPLRSCAAAALLLACGAAFAAAPEDAGAALSSLQAAYARAVEAGERADRYRALFATVFQRIERSHAAEVDLDAFAATAQRAIEPLPPGTGDPAEVFKTAVNTALRTLDPYSRYLDPVAHRIDRGDSGGSFGGLGLEVEAGGDAVRVVAPMNGSPAALAGLKRGDLIVRIDDQPLAGLPLAEAIARLRGAPGTLVSITVQRPGEQKPFTVSITRDTIRRQLLRWTMEDDVLVLRIGSFSGPVSSALQQAVGEALATQLPRAVLLDLRGNGGGLLREGVATADAFLGQGEIASMRGRNPANQRSWKADPTELLAGLPMVVLLDGRSASATELVAAALQANGRAIVMGQRSFGKGTVQTTFSLGDNQGALKLTTAAYLGPAGRAVQQVGVVPDIELVAAAAPASEPAADAAPPTTSSRRIEQGRCAALHPVKDPALACAIAYLLAGDADAFMAATADSR